jgi:hypothetical protein
MEAKKEQRPLIVEIDDAKQEIIRVVNKAIQRGLPCYLIDMILSDIYTQVKEGAKNELAMARQAGATEVAPTVQND